jgi:hypothetical protein
LFSYVCQAGVGAAVPHSMRLGHEHDGDGGTGGNTFGNYVIDQSSLTMDLTAKAAAKVYPKPEAVGAMRPPTRAHTPVLRIRPEPFF